MRIAICFVLALAAASSCKKDNKKAEPGSGETGGSGSQTMSNGSSGGSNEGGSGDAKAMSHHAGNCPSTVGESTTKAEIKDKTIVVTITSDNKDAQLAIQKRTDELLKEHQEKKTPSAGHDRRGTHGGRSGLCPIHIPEGATAEAKHTDHGVEVTITPKDNVDDLKKDIDARIVRAADWMKGHIKPGDKGNQAGTGGGKAEEGMNRSGSGDAKGMERRHKDGDGGGKGTGGGGGKGTGGGTGSGDKKDAAKGSGGGGW